jgi:hypothetical protein
MNKTLTLRTSVLLAILAVVMVGVASFVSDFYSNGYLPSPFVYDKWDTFMDFFHPLFWAIHEGRYSEWSSVYPPLNFLLLKALAFIFIGSDEYTSAFMLRENATAFPILIVFLYAVVPAFVVTRDYWQRFSRAEKFLIYLIYVGSTPLLFSLERGNLVVFALLILPFVFDGSVSKRAIAIGILVNLKAYFAVLYIAYVLKGQWRSLYISLLVGALIFLWSGLFLDREYYLLFKNLLGFSQSQNLFSPREVLSMPSSVSAFSYVLALPTFAGSSLSELIHQPILAASLLNSLKWAALIFAVLALIKGRSILSDQWIFGVLIVLITNLGVSVGGYTLIFYLVLVPIFCEMRLRYFYYLVLALLVLPLDLISIKNDVLGTQTVYITQQITTVEWSLGLGSLMRPVLNFLLVIALSVECIMELKNNLLKVQAGSTSKWLPEK